MESVSTGTGVMYEKPKRITSAVKLQQFLTALKDLRDTISKERGCGYERLDKYIRTIPSLLKNKEFNTIIIALYSTNRNIHTYNVTMSKQGRGLTLVLTHNDIVQYTSIPLKKVKI